MGSACERRRGGHHRLPYRGVVGPLGLERLGCQHRLHRHHALPLRPDRGKHPALPGLGHQRLRPRHGIQHRHRDHKAKYRTLRIRLQSSPAGPGAVYAGDLTQLVGPAASRDQGDFAGNVPLESLERHLWIYESAFYKELIGKARLTDPTPLTTTGETITIQHACINRVLLSCKLLKT